MTQVEQTGVDYVDGIETDESRRWHRRTAVEMTVSGIIGLIASMVLSVEAWQLAQDSAAKFSCDISSILSCSTVASTPQARILGFPNAFLGILFESVVLTVSVAIFARVHFPRWYMVCVNLLYTVALFFAYWLFLQSYFVIHVLCPWCLCITVTTTLVFAGLTRINIRDGVIPVPPSVRHFVDRGFDWSIWGTLLFIIAAMLVAGYGVDLFFN